MLFLGLSANQIARFFKLKTLKNYVWYGVDSLLPLKLPKIWSYFGLWPQKTLRQLICRILYFSLIWLLNLSSRGSIATLYLSASGISLHATSVCNVFSAKIKVYMALARVANCTCCSLFSNLHLPLLSIWQYCSASR